MGSLAMDGTASTLYSPYTLLSQYLTFANRDHYEWWRHKGPLLSKFLQDCNYNVHQQYQYLTLFHNHLIHELGAYTEPTVGQQGNTLLSGAGKLELDRRFTASGSSLRIAFEPTSYLAGDHGPDPLNVLPLPHVLSRLRELPGVDLGLDAYRTLVNRLTTSEADQRNLLQSQKLLEQLRSLLSRTQNILALDLVDGSVQTELYFQPQLKALATNSAVKTMLLESCQAMDTNKALGPALGMAEEFLRTSQETTQPLFLSCDLRNNTPVSSEKLKLFFIESHITWARAQALWTCGRSTEEHDAMLHPLRALWESLAVVEGPRTATEFPMMLIMKLCEEAPFVRPQIALPVVGMTEQAIGEAVVRFFTTMGWTKHAGTYMESLHSYYPGVSLEQPLGKQAWVAVSEFDAEGPALTVFYY
ncbi:aromatic prenyltransferase [Penicillium fimorum]|uniref:Aromatic prenyltransferase n=1 Tax=Penicillium fimorum TaxID=1882269 RepID=A0A9X0CB49_9EURO|nr:aromatic prenyltransferase [Penicillium fimorum]